MGYFMRTKRRYDKALADLIAKHDEFSDTNEIVEQMLIDYREVEARHLTDQAKDQFGHKVQQMVESSDYNSIVKGDKSKKKSSIKKKHLAKMYKQIVSQTHPDKMEQLGVDFLERPDREQIFREVVPAYKKLNIPVFFDCANEIRVTPGNIGHMAFFADALPVETKILEEKIDALKQTLAWRFYECQGDIDCQEELVKRAVKSMYT